VVSTDGSQPIGRGIGPSLEAQDVLAVLRCDPDALADLREKAITLAGALLELANAATANQGEAMATQALSTGRAWAAERPEVIAPLRRLIHSVVVHAQPGVKGSLEVEIKGRLQELLGAPFLRRSVGGGPLVAGEGLEPPTPGL
jgi:thymidine phosphorylase